MPQPAQTGRRVLVVDDDPDILQLVTERVQLAGCQTEVAHDGLEAVRRIQSFHPEAMVLDLSMPRMDGFGVLRWMRQQDVTAKVRTLVLTARNNPADVAQAIELGARDYLAKPFGDEQLLLRVARLLITSHEALAR